MKGIVRFNKRIIGARLKWIPVETHISHSSSIRVYNRSLRAKVPSTTSNTHALANSSSMRFARYSDPPSRLVPLASDILLLQRVRVTQIPQTQSDNWSSVCAAALCTQLLCDQLRHSTHCTIPESRETLFSE